MTFFRVTLLMVELELKHFDFSVLSPTYTQNIAQQLPLLNDNLGKMTFGGNYGMAGICCCNFHLLHNFPVLEAKQQFSSIILVVA